MIPKPRTPSRQKTSAMSSFIKEDPLDKFIIEHDVTSVSPFDDERDEGLFNLDTIGLDGNFDEDFHGETGPLPPLL